MNTPQLPHLLDLWQQTIGWQPTESQLQQFQQLYELILAGNQQLNLTRITDPQDFWEKHLWDSIRGITVPSPSSLVGQLHNNADAALSVPAALNLSSSDNEGQRTKDNGQRTTDNGQRTKDKGQGTKDKGLRTKDKGQFHVIDIGTGAGFPGLPVAIVYPESWMTLVDSTRKKIAFVDSAVKALGLKNTRTIADRAEHLATQPAHRGNYDVVLVRAVAAADLCLRYALPLLRPGGVAILYRGQWQPSDTEALQPVVAELGAHLATPDRFTTPLTNSQRCCLYLHKLRMESEEKMIVKEKM